MRIKVLTGTPEGQAITDLAKMMDELQADTGSWPGADTVDILGRWLSRFSFAVHENLTAQTTGRAWVLRQWDKNRDDVTLVADESSGLAFLAQHARRNWDNVSGTDEVPCLPPADDREAVDLYYEARDGIEHYVLYADDISRHVRAPRNVSLSDAEACAQANSAAVFHAQQGPDDEGLPCIEIAGILVFAYLDADHRAVRVSVHLDTADEQLLQSDGTVPLRIEVEDTTVLDSTRPKQRPRRPRWLRG
ncbi:hypothetical protein ABZ379_45455 [Streptomyces canus]|uniref:hypothetical protein n=1 Tax=Streptomyces canus TaxID=58343 RepID=UPI0033EEF4AD